MSLVMANALRDLKHTIGHQIMACSHINSIAPLDNISSVSFIHDIQEANGVEEITIKTLGLKNIDAERELINSQWPEEIFESKELRPAQLELILKNQMPDLLDRQC